MLNLKKCSTFQDAKGEQLKGHYPARNGFCCRTTSSKRKSCSTHISKYLAISVKKSTRTTLLSTTFCCDLPDRSPLENLASRQIYPGILCEWHRAWKHPEYPGREMFTSWKDHLLEGSMVLHMNKVQTFEPSPRSIGCAAKIKLCQGFFEGISSATSPPAEPTDLYIGQGAWNGATTVWPIKMCWVLTSRVGEVTSFSSKTPEICNELMLLITPGPSCLDGLRPACFMINLLMLKRWNLTTPKQLDQIIGFNGCWNGSRKRWDRWHSPSPNWQEKYHLYTTYSSCLLGGYMLPTIFYGNQKQPLIVFLPVLSPKYGVGWSWIVER